MADNTDGDGKYIFKDGAAVGIRGYGPEAVDPGIDNAVRLKAYDLAFGKLLNTLHESINVRAYGDDEREPDGGWDRWCLWASKKGKVARTLRTLSKNVIAFDFAGKNDKTVTLMRTKSRSIRLRPEIFRAHKDWQTLGRCCLEPVWLMDGETGKRKDLIKAKTINPMTVSVFRDSKSERVALRERFRDNAKVIAYLDDIDQKVRDGFLGSGDNIIAFVQHYKQETIPIEGTAVTNVDTPEPVFFTNTQLIFLSRYPDYDVPNGISLLRENFDIITDKMLLEDAQAAMAKAYMTPRMMHEIPMELWGKRDEIKAALRGGWTQGLDMIKPTGTKSEILEYTGSGAAQIKALEFTEDQFTAAMGMADSFTQSDSSNRSVGEIQLQFFERDLQYERDLFADVIREGLIIPYMETQGITKEEDFPEIEWADLVTQDQLSWAQVYISLLTVMDLDLTQQKKIYEYIGLPPDEDEWKQKEADRKKEKENPDKSGEDTPSGDKNNPGEPEGDQPTGDNPKSGADKEEDNRARENLALKGAGKAERAVIKESREDLLSVVDEVCRDLGEVINSRV